MSQDSGTGNKGEDNGPEELGRTDRPEESPDSDSELRLSKYVAERDGENEQDVT